ncbi:MAG: hypothetical protein ACKVY0_28270 [Prosthecobacter sp.]|uniref:hypothetical protein n=1 Tax=Prosthecobacter sp. TaxID=1965333 RepID=UPI0039034B91
MIEFSVGFGVVFVFMLMPFLACWIGRQADTEWVPVNDSYKYGSDDNIYAALVSSVRQRCLRFEWPAIDCEGCRDFEILRVGSYRLAALLGGWLPSPRWLHLVAQIMAVLVHYALVFAFIFSISGNSLAALCGSFCYLFGFSLFMSRRSRAIRGAFKTLFNFGGETHFDSINDHFRYVILSVAAIYGVSVLALLATASSHGGWWYTALGACLVLLPFSYPGIMLAFGLHATLLLTIHICHTGDTLALTWLLAGIIPPALFLLITGRIRRLMHALATAPPVLNLIHCGTAASDNTSYLRKWCAQFFSPPVVLAPVSTGIAFTCGVALGPSTAVLLTAMIISALGSTPGVGRAVARMQFRGAATLYQAVFFATLAAAISPMLVQATTFGWTFLSIFIFFLLRASLRTLRTHIANQTFAINAARWTLYTYLRKSASPEDTVACLDITDMQLVPVYAAGTVYVGGGEWLQPPHLAIARQAGLMQHCGINPSVLIDWLHGYFTQKPLLNTTPLPPHAPDEAVEGVVTLNHLVFYPYITQFDGVPISTDRKSWTPAFIERFSAAVESGTLTGISDDRPPDFILISARQEQHRAQPGAVPPGYRRTAAAGGHLLYKRV